jgi:hypothetical protein
MTITYIVYIATFIFYGETFIIEIPHASYTKFEMKYNQYVHYWDIWANKLGFGK